MERYPGRSMYLSVKVKHETKPRSYVGCGKSFLSTGPGNRICARCAGSRNAVRDRVGNDREVVE